MTKDDVSAGSSRSGSGDAGWLESAANWSLVILIVLLPLGTRYFFVRGSIGGETVEWGTVSLFVTQVLAGTFAALAIFADRRRLSWAVAWPAAALAVAVLVAALFSADPLRSVFGAAGWWCLGLAVWLGVRLVRPSGERVIGAFVASAVAQSLLAIGQFVFQRVPASKWLGMAAQSASVSGVSVVESADGRWLRAYGTLPHPNVLGIFCVVGLIMALWMLWDRTSRHRVAAAMALPIISLGMVFSFSRSAWLAAIVGTVLMAATEFFRSDRSRRTVIGLSLGIVGVTALGAVLTVPGPFLSRVSASGRLEQMSVSERFSALEDAERLFVEHPVIGVGPGEMPYAVAASMPGRNAWSYQPVHVLPAVVAAETGLIGLLAWLLWLAWPCAAAYRSGRRRLLIKGPFAAALLAVLVAGMFDHYAWTLWTGAALLCLLAGLATAGLDADAPQ